MEYPYYTTGLSLPELAACLKWGQLYFPTRLLRPDQSGLAMTEETMLGNNAHQVLTSVRITSTISTRGNTPDNHIRHSGSGSRQLP